jgi:predicted oxidoreductase
VESSELGTSGIRVSRLGYGCMRIAGDGGRDDRDTGKRAVRAAIDSGYTLFDHADIYGGGACEALFGEVLRETPSLRDGLTIVTKCGIRVAGDPHPGDPKRYDFRASYITASAEGSLDRLGTDHVDLFLLHRPDYLMDPDEVAGALTALVDSGKVGHVGVSNFSPSQVELLAASLSLPLLVNQVEINIHNIGALTDGTLDQCRRLGMTPQAWCPVAGVAYPAWRNTFGADDETRIRAELGRQAAYYGVDDWQAVLAWLLAHPAGICPIIGSTTPARIAAAPRAFDIDYRREDWYRLLEARNGKAVP